MRILLAEDDPLLGDGLRAGLRQLGSLVDWVRDGVCANSRPSRSMLPFNAGSRATATLLAILVRNLVDNAVRYSPRRAIVRISVEGGEEGVRFRVEDSGPGLCDADMHRLGERFFTVLGSGEGGSGLGWSIVRRIAAAHGTNIQVSRSPALGGLRTDVVWPLVLQGR